jgi:hypothetical protein
MMQPTATHKLTFCVHAVASSTRYFRRARGGVVCALRTARTMSFAAATSPMRLPRHFSNNAEPYDALTNVNTINTKLLSDRRRALMQNFAFDGSSLTSV